MAQKSFNWLVKMYTKIHKEFFLLLTEFTETVRSDAVLQIGR
jgi:hypothetical protein